MFSTAFCRFFVVVGQIVFDAFDRGGQVGDEIVVDFLAGVEAAGGGAVLSGIVEAEGLDAFDDGGDIGIVENHDGGLAAQFQMGALDGGHRGLNRPLAGRDAAGDRHHCDSGMID